MEADKRAGGSGRRSGSNIKSETIRIIHGEQYSGTALEKFFLSSINGDPTDQYEASFLLLSSPHPHYYVRILFCDQSAPPLLDAAPRNEVNLQTNSFHFVQKVCLRAVKDKGSTYKREHQTENVLKEILLHTCCHRIH